MLFIGSAYNYALTWTTYPDLNLKSDCCFLPLTSTTPLMSREFFLPDKTSNNLNNEINTINQMHKK